MLAALGIDLGKHFKVLVERDTHTAIGFIVAPSAARGTVNLDPAANQLLAKLDELLDAFLECRELRGIICPDEGFPVFDYRQDLVIELEKPVAVLFHVGRCRGHIDSAGFHHDGIDQRIDALDV